MSLTAVMEGTHVGVRQAALVDEQLPKDARYSSQTRMSWRYRAMIGPRINLTISFGEGQHTQVREVAGAPGGCGGERRRPGRRHLEEAHLQQLLRRGALRRVLGQAAVHHLLERLRTPQHTAQRCTVP